MKRQWLLTVVILEAVLCLSTCNEPGPEEWARATAIARDSEARVMATVTAIALDTRARELEQQKAEATADDEIAAKETSLRWGTIALVVIMLGLAGGSTTVIWGFCSAYAARKRREAAEIHVDPRTRTFPLRISRVGPPLAVRVDWLLAPVMRLFNPHYTPQPYTRLERTINLEDGEVITAWTVSDYGGRTHSWVERQLLPDPQKMLIGGQIRVAGQLGERAADIAKVSRSPQPAGVLPDLAQSTPLSRLLLAQQGVKKSGQRGEP